MTKNNAQWFDTDRKGLAQLLERRGKASLLYELWQNAADADGTTKIDITLEPVTGAPKIWLTVTDDSPQGFLDLSHAYTLFAPSAKKGDVKKRGRFNFGEKLVLAVCDEAEIWTTTGGVRFDDKGRHKIKRRTQVGSVFAGLMRMTRDEYAEVLEGLKRLIPPSGVTTTIITNAGDPQILQPRTPVKTFSAYLQTVKMDDAGNLQRSYASTEVRVHEPRAGEVASIYEMGIPVVELEGDRYHLDVQQKVPVNLDRENVPPGFLADLRAAALNAIHEALSKEDMASAWVTAAITSDDVKPETLSAVLDARYGAKRVVYDPSDVEANKRAVAAGYAVIPGGALPKEAWQMVRDHGLAQPAGQVTPGHHENFSPDGRPIIVIAAENWTDAMRLAVRGFEQLAEALLEKPIRIVMACDPGLKGVASFGNNTLILNKLRLKDAFFEHCEGGLTEELIGVAIHEFAHDKVADHLSDEFHEECCRLGAKLARLLQLGMFSMKIAQQHWDDKWARERAAEAVMAAAGGAS